MYYDNYCTKSIRRLNPALEAQTTIFPLQPGEMRATYKSVLELDTRCVGPARG